jgi:hypothetical protein
LVSVRDPFEEVGGEQVQAQPGAAVQFGEVMVQGVEVCAEEAECCPIGV